MLKGNYLYHQVSTDEYKAEMYMLEFKNVSFKLRHFDMNIHDINLYYWLNYMK